MLLNAELCLCEAVDISRFAYFKFNVLCNDWHHNFIIALNKGCTQHRKSLQITDYILICV